MVGLCEGTWKSMELRGSNRNYKWHVSLALVLQRSSMFHRMIELSSWVRWDAPRLNKRKHHTLPCMSQLVLVPNITCQHFIAARPTLRRNCKYRKSRHVESPSLWSPMHIEASPPHTLQGFGILIYIWSSTVLLLHNQQINKLLAISFELLNIITSDWEGGVEIFQRKPIANTVPGSVARLKSGVVILFNISIELLTRNQSLVFCSGFLIYAWPIIETRNRLNSRSSAMYPKSIFTAFKSLTPCSVRMCVLCNVHSRGIEVPQPQVSYR